MGVTMTISRQEMAKYRKNLKKFGITYGAGVRKAMDRAGKEMESVAKLTVNNAGLVDTGRLKSSLVPQPIDNGYGQEIRVNLSEEGQNKAPKKGEKSGTPKGTVSMVNYAIYHEPRVKFLEKGQKAGMAAFKTIMKTGSCLLYTSDAADE